MPLAGLYPFELVEPVKLVGDEPTDVLKLTLLALKSGVKELPPSYNPVGSTEYVGWFPTKR